MPIWELHNEELRCIKPLLSLAIVTVVVITEHRKTFFLIHPNEALCFASVSNTDMEEGWTVGDKGTTTTFFFFFEHTKKNQDDKRE